jgi:hypothetical protein
MRESEIVDILIESCRKDFEKTGDSVHVWQCIGYLNDYRRYPDWVRRYLFNVSKKLLNLGRSGKAYPNKVVSSLGLKQSAISRADKKSRDVQLQTLVQILNSKVPLERCYDIIAGLEIAPKELAGSPSAENIDDAVKDFGREFVDSLLEEEGGCTKKPLVFGLSGEPLKRETIQKLYEKLRSSSNKEENESNEKYEKEYRERRDLYYQTINDNLIKEAKECSQMFSHLTPAGLVEYLEDLTDPVSTTELVLCERVTVSRAAYNLNIWAQDHPYILRHGYCEFLSPSNECTFIKNKLSLPSD